MKTTKKEQEQSWSDNTADKEGHSSPTARQEKQEGILKPIHADDVKQGGTIYGSVKGTTDINDDDLIAADTTPPQPYTGEQKFPEEEKLKDISEGLGHPDDEDMPTQKI